ncbi:PREDICTED: natural killer cell receptor 2B4 [Elephantulus edwardii]|uniref:natural killer cell receptor 2B4 n=1 Tax=Elephantulus edwardii TaxID=28737 RepID=UPI0003F0C828|nr:PREDICTED: natural killer cell receptor 2B4 [Elephantulus edwardii]
MARPEQGAEDGNPNLQASGGASPTGGRLLLLPPPSWLQEFSPEQVHFVAVWQLRYTSLGEVRCLPSHLGWKVKFDSKSDIQVIVTQKKANVTYEDWLGSHFNNTLNFTSKDLTLSIKKIQHQDSGTYTLELTGDDGIDYQIKFQVSVFDHVGKVHWQEERKTLDSGMCQVTLSCLAFNNKSVSYTWYNESKLIQTWRNHTHLVEQIDGGNWSTYTCNISNPVSWRNHTFNLTQGCGSDHQNFQFQILVVIIVVPLVILFLAILTGFFVWWRKRKQPRNRSEECLTTYELINHPQINRNQDREQEQERGQEQNPSGESSTIYSKIQAQGYASTSHETSHTIYSVIQPFLKPGPKKNQSPSFSKTIYEEVGKRQPRAQNPTRLSQKELENFQCERLAGAHHLPCVISHAGGQWAHIISCAGSRRAPSPSVDGQLPPIISCVDDWWVLTIYRTSSPTWVAGGRVSSRVRAAGGHHPPVWAAGGCPSSCHLLHGWLVGASHLPSVISHTGGWQACIISCKGSRWACAIRVAAG